MPRNTDLGIVYPACDLEQGRTFSAEIQFVQSGNVVSCELPMASKGVALFAKANPALFALDEAPLPQQVNNDQGLKKAIMTPGAMAQPDIWTRRTLPQDGQAHTLYVMSTAVNSVVDIEVW